MEARSAPTWTWKTPSPRWTPPTRCWPIATGWADEGRPGRRGQQGRRDLHRRHNPIAEYQGADGQPLSLHGRSLLFIRNVGHLMTNPAVLLEDGREIPEGILDAVVTVTIALHDLKRQGNSRSGSVYIVNNQDARPAEVAFAVQLFDRVEALLRLPAQYRQAGHHGRGAAHQRQPQGLHPCRRGAGGLHQYRLSSTAPATRCTPPCWRPHAAQGRHEDLQVDHRLRAQQRAGRPGSGLRGKAQIGKGMWALPDLMAAMWSRRSAIQGGANTAWVPSPTAAAVLHALHFHQVKVQQVAAGAGTQRRHDAPAAN